MIANHRQFRPIPRRKRHPVAGRLATSSSQLMAGSIRLDTSSILFDPVQGQFDPVRAGA
jgi:hypothetical protein